MRGLSPTLGFAVAVLVVAAGSAGALQQSRTQAVDRNGAPVFKVDPFWPKPLPNRWSMQQVTGVFVDQHDHIWFVNRADGKVLGQMGSMGENGGQWFGLHMIAVDSKGVIYTGEVFAGERVQRFLPN